MGVLQPDTDQDCKKKLLPKKPLLESTDQSLAITEQSFENELFGEEANLETSWEEDLWMAVSPAQSIVKTPDTLENQENPLGEVFIEVEVNNNVAIPSGAVLIAENVNDEESYSFPEEASEDPKDFWGLHTFQDSNMQHAPAALVEGINCDENEDNFDEMHDSMNNIEDIASEVDNLYNMDIVQFAIGDSGISLLGLEDAENNENAQPMGTTASFITNSKAGISQSQVLPVYAKKSSPYALQSKPVMKKKVGRPERTIPLKITSVPVKGVDGLTQQQLEILKHRRMRDLNNEASKKCREKRKMKQTVIEDECSRMEERNRLLLKKLQRLESEVSLWSSKCASAGCSILTLNKSEL